MTTLLLLLLAVYFFAGGMATRDYQVFLEDEYTPEEYNKITINWFWRSGIFLFLIIFGGLIQIGLWCIELFFWLRIQVTTLYVKVKAAIQYWRLFGFKGEHLTEDQLLAINNMWPVDIKKAEDVVMRMVIRKVNRVHNYIPY